LIRLNEEGEEGRNPSSFVVKEKKKFQLERQQLNRK